MITAWGRCPPKVGTSGQFLPMGQMIVVQALIISDFSWGHMPPMPMFNVDCGRTRHLEKVEVENNSIKLNVTVSLDSVIKEISNYEVLNVISEEPSLEDLFMNYYEIK